MASIKFSVVENGLFQTLVAEGGPCSRPQRQYVINSIIINGRIVAVGDGIGSTIIVDTDWDDLSQIETVMVYDGGRRPEYCDNVARRRLYKPEKLYRVELNQSFLDWFQSLM